MSQQAISEQQGEQKQEELQKDRFSKHQVLLA